MLNKKDVEVLRGMFQEQKKEILGEIGGVLRSQKTETLGEIEGLLHVQKREILDQTRALLVQTEKRVINDITDFIGDEILPQIDEHTREIGMIKRHLQLA